MLKHIADLSGDYEYFIGWAGQSTSRPWGSKSEAYNLFSEYEAGATGIDLTGVTITSGSGTETLAVTTTLQADQWVGAHLRLGTTSLAVAGYARVIANTAATLTVEWIKPALSYSAVTMSATNPTVVTHTGHGFSNGTPVVMKASTFPTGGPTWAAGVVYYVNKIDANSYYLCLTSADATNNTNRQGATSTGTDVEIANAAAVAAAVPGIITYEDYRFAYRPQVRILTPYQPTTDSTTNKLVEYPDPTATIADGGRSVKMPGFTTPAGLTFERAAALLPFTFNEGIDSYGHSELDDAAQSAGSSSLVTANLVSGYFINGYIRVDWYGSGEAKVSWQRIASNDTTTFTLAGNWLGDGTPTGTAADWRWTAWVPHYNNNPWCYAPGEGYDYPNNDMHPCAFSVNGAAIHNRPRNITGSAYGDRFGDLLIVAQRMSMATGKRINVVHLGINAASLAPVNVINTFGFDGILGWYDHRNAGAWAQSLGGEGIFQRLDTLLRYSLPNALAAEGNTKTPKFLAWFYSQGETDALKRGSRLHYRESLRGLKAAIRNTIKELGYSPYVNGAEMPWVQAKVMHVPYELSGTYPYYSDPNYNFTGDGESLVNNAILEENAGDEFGEWIYTDDLPRLATDPGHLNGVGECARGARSSKRMAEMIDHALGYGSPCLIRDDARVALYNRALAAIGEAPTLQSLDDGSYQARLCAMFANEVRDELLQARQWSFALRRVALTEVKMPQQPLYTQWGHCYVMPPEALNAFQVLPPDVVETPPTEAELISWAVDPAYAYTLAFVAAWDETLALNTSIDPATVNQANLPLVAEDALKPQPFQVERSPHGGRYIFTNQEQATLQYVERVADITEWPAAFADAFCQVLGSKLAGALIKGQAGEQAAARLLQKAGVYMRMASSSDAAQRRGVPNNRDFIPGHLADR